MREGYRDIFTLSTRLRVIRASRRSRRGDTFQNLLLSTSRVNIFLNIEKREENCNKLQKACVREEN